MVPVPMVTSAKPLAWAKRAPARPTSPLLSAMPAAVVRPRSMPCASAMRRLTPTARMARPAALLRKRPRRSTAATATMPAKSGRSHMPRNSGSKGVNTVGSVRRATFGLPMMRRLIE